MTDAMMSHGDTTRARRINQPRRLSQALEFVTRIRPRSGGISYAVLWDATTSTNGHAKAKPKAA